MTDNEITLKLSREQYLALTKLIYFADFCVSNRLLSEFDDSELREVTSELLEKIYKLAQKLDISTSISLNSLASEIPYSEQESLVRKKLVEADLAKISKIIFANEFAKRDLKLPLNDWMFDHEGGWESNNRLIFERMQPYLKEFDENGISNLRFKIFYSLPSEDE